MGSKVKKITEKALNTTIAELQSALEEKGIHVAVKQRLGGIDLKVNGLNNHQIDQVVAETRAHFKKLIGRDLEAQEIYITNNPLSLHAERNADEDVPLTNNLPRLIDVATHQLDASFGRVTTRIEAPKEGVYAGRITPDIVNVIE